MAALEETGWRPLTTKRVGAEAFVVTPFGRLARTHAAAVAGDTLVAMALAGSLFFSIDPSQAKSKVALYLALTMAPFSLVAPLIGPWLDRVRGGRRWVIVMANAARAGICLLMVRDLDRLYLFPEAFSVLVLSKGYQVAKSALVPTVVQSDGEFVAANSRLSLLSAIMGFVAVIPGGIAILLADGQGALVLASLVFALAAGLGVRIPATRVAAEPENTLERRELRGGAIRLAASAMGLLRGIVGFLFFLLAFELRTSDAAPWRFGVVLAASAIGALLGALVAPALRQNGVNEEGILQLLLGLTAVAGLASAFIGPAVGGPLLAMAVGLAAGGGKLAFDSIVQRDAPDANRGRSFARFETRFQLTWVIGALIPVLLSIPAWLGFVVVAGCGAFALVTYMASLRALARGEPVKSYSGNVRAALARLRESRS
jgi:Major Facilitator Superfamily